MNARRLARMAVIGAAWGSISLRAAADGPSRDDPRARAFFDVGAEAYGKGQYLLAIDAFQEAYSITERSGLLFSIAQAHQRQFRASGDEQHLAQAIEYYRRYLERVGSGGRAGEASRSLNQLLLITERLHPPNQGSAPGRAQVFGRLLLSSRTPNVILTVNGDVVEALPTALELPADRYRIVAEAKGYERRVEEVSLVAGAAFPLSIELRPLPAQLEVTGPREAELFIDGRSFGWLPIAVLTLPEGEHWVSARRFGYRTSNALVRLERGQLARVTLKQETTTQRQAARVVGAGAVVGIGVAATLALLAYRRDEEASDLDERRSSSSIGVSEGKRLNDALEARDQLRSGAIVAGTVSAAMLGSSLLLYFADSPAPPAVPPTGAAPAQVAFSLQPWLGAGWGIGARGAF